VNVQHLESLNDQVAELTGVRVRETFPDSVLAQADEVVLVDLTPSTLIERLQAGKVYPAARVPAALNGFFRVENLEALREVALRQVAEDVEAKRLKEDVLAPREDRLQDRAAPQTVGERLLALVTPQPSSQRIVRRAWRSAQRLGAALDVLIVLPREPTDAEREQIDAFHRLASLLGAQVLVEEGDDLAEVAARVAGERGSTYVLIGPPAPRRGLRRFSEPLTDQLVRALPGIDVRIVADRSKRKRTP
jgi:two-component system sensor histidine kinase KdpD